MNMTEKITDGSLLTAEDVEGYLRRNPDFFLGRPELLAEISIPHRPGEAVSLVEKQVRVLREQNEQARKRLHELIEIAKLNEDLAHRMHHLVLTLIDAASPGEIFKTLYENLKRNFRAEQVAVRLFAQPAGTGIAAMAEFVGKQAGEAALFESLIEKRLPVVGVPALEQQAFLFGPEGADIASVVLVPLRGGDWGGVMAIGSRDPDRFQQGMGVELLANMGEVLSFILKPWIAVEPG